MSDAPLAEFVNTLADDPQGRRMLEAIFGNSPYLTEIALREAAFLRELVAAGPHDSFGATIRETHDALAGESDRLRFMAGLRRAKRRVALLVALADIGNLWTLVEVTSALSDFADTALRLTARHLLRQAAAAGTLELADPSDPEHASGLIILAMGKLGGRELNYSSDIDLIVLYDDALVRPVRPDDMARIFVRLARDMVRIMEERTAEGYVFRTDLRLRPDPAATPLAVSVTAAETYYGSMALTWERAAMIKARPVAGDLDAGRNFLASIRPFVWRRTLDFAAIRDIHGIRRQIKAHRGHADVAVAGHDVKIGRGGIREIEFLAQTRQLIFGGRDPRLRVAGTLACLQALADQGRINQATAQTLVEAYGFLRRIEHRLQMIDDHQTHQLPHDEAAIDALAIFLGFDAPAQFRQRLEDTLRRVQQHYAELFEDEPDLFSGETLNFAGTDDDPETVQALRALGFGNPPQVIELVRGWMHGRYRSTRSERARSLLTQVAPMLLEALARTPNPDSTLLRFDEFLSRQPAGVQIFSMFHANPSLLDLLAHLLGASSRVADYLARNPRLLDAVLTPGFMERLPDLGTLERELAEQLAVARHYEEALDLIRRWTNDHRFRANVHILRQISNSQDCSGLLSNVAECALRALQSIVETEFTHRHGDFGRPALAVVAMGKLGGREMSPRSDVDLIMVYDGDEAASESSGSKPLPPAVYYARLIQRFVGAITAQSAEGPLYEVDMRLRPSGNKGPVATSLEAFLRYHQESAWTWEHMAMTRARVITGPPALRTQLEAAIQTALTLRRDYGKLLSDVAEMRLRIAKQFPGRSLWDVKYWRGGLIDIEFIAQYLQLRHANDNPHTLHPNTATASARLVEAGFLDRGAGADLTRALTYWQRIQSYLQLTAEGSFDPAGAPGPIKEGLVRAVYTTPDKAVTFEQLEADMHDAAQTAYRHFRSIIEDRAAALGPLTK